MPQLTTSKPPLKTMKSKKNASATKIEGRVLAYSIVTLNTDEKGKTVRDSNQCERDFHYETMRR